MVIKLPELHRAQQVIAQSKARFKVVSCGRRFGKGVLGIILCFLFALTGFSIPPREGKVWWVCPSFQSASFSSGWRLAQKIAQQIPRSVIHQQQKTITFAHGGWIQFKSAEEPDSLRGEGIDFVVIDEAAHIKQLKDLWEQCLRATLSDRRGKAMFISTPKGFNYFYELFKRTETDTEWASFHFASKDRPTFDIAEYDAAKLELPSLIFRQEYDAEFCQLAGELIKREWLKIVESYSVPRFVRSWDLAYSLQTRADYTAGVMGGLADDGTFVIGHMVHGRWEIGSSTIIKDTILMDGDNVIQGIEVVGPQLGTFQALQADPELAKIAIRIIKADRDKITRAVPFITRAGQGKIALIRGAWNKTFIDECCSFPDGQHDDIVDAASGALKLFSETTGANTMPKAFGRTWGARVREERAISC